MAQAMHVLVVDDEEKPRSTLDHLLRTLGHMPTVCKDSQEALQHVQSEPFDIAFVDWRLEGDAMQGPSLAKAIRAVQDIHCVVYTRHIQPEAAERAILNWELDDVIVVEKEQPFAERVRLILARIRRQSDITSEELRWDDPDGFMLVGKSPKMHDAYERIRKVAPLPTTVLVRGDSGTGKELAARAIHFLSVRKGGPFKAVNCSSLAENLLESELFGHVKGAFTGATTDKCGHIEAASGGTLFLDEIGDLSLATQVKLLRVLQERVIQRVGGDKPIPVDIRIIAATHRDLEKFIDEEQFRGDLYFRVKTYEINLPPLRERSEDIPLLVCHVVEKFAREFEKSVPTVSAEAMRAFRSYGWPGNVRELENAIQHALVEAEDSHELRLEHLPADVRCVTPGAVWGAYWPVPWTAELKGALSSLELMMFKWALEQCKGNQTQAAGLLGIDRSYLNRKMKTLSLR